MSAPGGPALRALGCTRCGGALELREGAPLVRCPYCRSVFLARDPGGVFRFLAPARITPRIAEAAARETFLEARCPPDLARSAVRASCDLFYVPFWRFRATFVGRVRGMKDIVSRRPVRVYHGDEEGGGGAVIELEEVRVGQEEVVEEIQEIWKATVSASPLHDLGVPRLDSDRQLPGGLAPLAAGAAEFEGLSFEGGEGLDGRLIDPMLPAAEARREAAIVFDRFARGRGAELRDRDFVFERLQERESLIFYPVYRVRFRYGGRLFSVTVDGLGGRIVRAILPAGRPFDVLPLTFVTAATALFVGAALNFALSPPGPGPGGADPAGRVVAWLFAAGAAAAGATLVGALVRRFSREEEDVVLTP